jgi:metal-responsive CopG/Arc/MetJ family transcriptional regulator
MKTIAITIEEAVLDRLDRLPRRRGDKKRNRSQIIREAVREYIARLEHEADTVREAAVVRRHRDRLAQEARALVRDQATP